MEVTYKISYSCKDDLFEIIKSYNNLLHFTYNRLLENSKLKTAEMTALQKTINKPDYVKSHLMNSAIYDAKALIKQSNKPIIFGGKKLFLQRCQNKIPHEEFVIKRLMPLYSVGEANYKGNRLFRLQDENTIIFSLDRYTHLTLNLHSVGSKRSKEIRKLIEIQNNRLAPITYKLDLNFVYITFDFNLLKTYSYRIKQNRVIAIDMNPNNVGYSVVDWLNENKYNLIASGSFSLKPLNDYQNSLNVSSDNKEAKYVTNKRKHEVIHIAKQLFKICKHYKCEIFAIEKLYMKSSNKGKGIKFNKLCNNQWCRVLLTTQLRKYIDASSTIFQEVIPNYTSQIGNLIYRSEKLPDEILASIEINRRGFEFANQYIFKRRPIKKNIVFPDLKLVKSQLALSLEELGVGVPSFDDWKSILSAVKKSKVKYRFSILDVPSKSLFSKFYRRKYLIYYNYL